ncbi:MAG: hypothetical protein KDE27_28370 [Planctomycetes bacterium]|nr:hypothetical protein [Planctomycetota bacterium]
MIMIGAAAVAIVVVIFLIMPGGGDDSGKTSGGDSKPAVADKSTPLQAQPASAGTAKTGKTPARPAPPLSQETLTKLDELLAAAKVHYNAGVTARNAGNNAEARAEQAKAKEQLDQWEQLVEAQLRWQEEAEMEEWAQPAEYDLLTRRYPQFSKLQKSVRMGGGK